MANLKPLITSRDEVRNLLSLTGDDIPNTSDGGALAFRALLTPWELGEHQKWTAWEAWQNADSSSRRGPFLPWDEARRAAFRSMWNECWSHEEMAVALGYFDFMAVRQAADRLGLPKRPTIPNVFSVRRRQLSIVARKAEAQRVMLERNAELAACKSIGKAIRRLPVLLRIAERRRIAKERVIVLAARRAAYEQARLDRIQKAAQDRAASFAGKVGRWLAGVGRILAKRERIAALSVAQFIRAFGEWRKALLSAQRKAERAAAIAFAREERRLSSIAMREAQCMAKAMLKASGDARRVAQASAVQAAAIERRKERANQRIQARQKLAVSLWESGSALPEIAHKLHLSQRETKRFLTSCGVRLIGARRIWTNLETKTLRELVHEGTSTQECATHFGRTASEIDGQIKKMGLTETEGISVDRLRGAAAKRR